MVQPLAMAECGLAEHFASCEPPTRAGYRHHSPGVAFTPSHAFVVIRNFYVTNKSVYEGDVNFEPA